MISKSAHYYDAIYSFKDYPTETETIRSIIAKEKRTDGNRLLDVACGTGLHMQYLSEYFEVEGIDLDNDMLGHARRRVPGAKFHQGDMADFNLGIAFDVIICLFSSIGYVQTSKRLNDAIRCMAEHLVTGGVMIVEPWYTPEKWHPGTVHAKFIDEPELKIARVNTSYMEGKVSYFDMHYLVGTPEGTDHYVERHELGLFTIEEMTVAFESAGLAVFYEPEGLMGRGLYIGRK